MDNCINRLSKKSELQFGEWYWFGCNWALTSQALCLWCSHTVCGDLDWPHRTTLTKPVTLEYKTSRRRHRGHIHILSTVCGWTWWPQRMFLLSHIEFCSKKFKGSATQRPVTEWEAAWGEAEQVRTQVCSSAETGLPDCALSLRELCAWVDAKISNALQVSRHQNTRHCSARL